MQIAASKSFNEEIRLDSIEEAVDQLVRGGMAVVVDDPSRENEGDLVMAAVHVTPEAVNFMATEARGLICVAMRRQRLEELGLPPIAARSDDPFGTAFHVAVDLADRASTGISAADRARTIAALADPASRAEDFVCPGHVFPLAARDGGVLARRGHTEASVDLCALGGLPQAGVICEIANDDGEMARLPELRQFADRHGLPLVAIAELRAELRARTVPAPSARGFAVSLNLALVLADSARVAPEDPALVHAGKTTTFGQLERASAQLAGWLWARGLGPGDRVALMLPNVPEFAIAYYGILRAGMVVVPMNPQLRQREVDYYLQDSGAALLIADEGPFAEAAGADPFEEVVRRDPSDPAVFLYTSGTTGKPKAAVLSHSNLLWNAEVTSETFGIQAGDRLLGTLPLFHSFGQSCVLNGAVRRRATVVLLPRFAPHDALALIEREGITHFYGVPTMFVALLQALEERAADVSSLRLCLSGGASIARETLAAFQRRFDVRVLEGYGLSETAPACCFSRVDTPAKPGTIGRPLWGVEMRVTGEDGAPLPCGEVGEIQVRSHGMMTGYHGRPEATAAAIDPAGWLRTGDLAYFDADGDYFIVDRKKDLILRGGYNVYPREVEEVLYEHPGVLEAAVVGLPDERLGEEVGAALVARPGCELGVEQLSAFLDERVAAYKRPRRFVFLPELPKGPTGKILKRELGEGLFAATPAEAPASR